MFISFNWANLKKVLQNIFCILCNFRLVYIHHPLPIFHDMTFIINSFGYFKLLRSERSPRYYFVQSDLLNQYVSLNNIYHFSKVQELYNIEPSYRTTLPRIMRPLDQIVGPMKISLRWRSNRRNTVIALFCKYADLQILHKSC